MLDRRIGQFEIDMFCIDERPEQARAALRDVIVLRAEAMHHSGSIEYIGIHPSFAVCQLGDVPPKYVAEIKTNGDGSIARVTWKSRG